MSIFLVQFLTTILPTTQMAPIKNPFLVDIDSILETNSAVIPLIIRLYTN